MNKITELEHGLIQVYFHTLPIGTLFLHKGNFYEKIDAELVTEFCSRSWVFESHYGCLISEKQFEVYGLGEKDIRED